jgi:biopolymer transport protein ExbB
MRIRHRFEVAAIAVMLAGGMVSAQTAEQDPAPAGEGAAPVVANAQPARQLTLLELLLKGGSLMYPLGLASIVMVAFAIERAIALRRDKILPPGTLSVIRTAVGRSQDEFDSQGLLKDLETHADPLARVAASGLRKANRTVQEIEKAIEDAGAKEAGILRRNCRVLSMVASISPLLGLMGTVTGMIKAFMTVAARAEALGRTELLAAGIYEALVTTAVGLAIAIPSLVLYYFYMEKVESFVTELDTMAEELVAKIPAKG